MKSTNQIELNELVERLKHDSLNTETMNQIALAYYENSELKNNSEILISRSLLKYRLDLMT